jgi:hypothetical protein
MQAHFSILAHRSSTPIPAKPDSITPIPPGSQD